MDAEDEWAEDCNVPPILRAKILCLKVCRHRCLTYASSEAALEIGNPVLKMFATLLDYGGSFSPEANDE